MWKNRIQNVNCFPCVSCNISEMKHWSYWKVKQDFGLGYAVNSEASSLLPKGSWINQYGRKNKGKHLERRTHFFLWMRILRSKPPQYLKYIRWPITDRRFMNVSEWSRDTPNHTSTLNILIPSGYSRMNTLVGRCLAHSSIYPLSKVSRKLLVCSQRAVGTTKRSLRGRTRQRCSCGSQSRGKTAPRNTAASWLTPSSWQGKTVFPHFSYFIMQ